MKLIFAQGNPGEQYKNSRHNVGFLVADAFARQQKASFTSKPKFHASIAELSFDGEKIFVVEPTTFYNETGQAARLLIDFYTIPTKDILVIHDDLALPFGTLRTREKGSDAGNNGIKSLNAHIGQDYTRLRIGIGSELSERIPAADFVLANFNRAEATALRDTIIPTSIDLIQDFCADRLPMTSRKL